MVKGIFSFFRQMTADDCRLGGSHGSKGVIPLRRRICPICCIVMLAALLLTACPLMKKDDFLPAEEAHIKLQDANQEIMANMEELMETPAMKTTHFLMNLLSEEPVWMPPVILNQQVQAKQFPWPSSWFLSQNPDLFNGMGELGEVKGVYRYNFNTQSFDLAIGSTNYLRYIFPSDSTAMQHQNLNASLSIDKLQYIQIVYTGNNGTHSMQALSYAEAQLFVDNQTIMSFEYEADFNSQGLSTSVQLSMIMPPYQLRMSQSGRDQNFSSTMSLTKTGNSLMGYSLSIRYSDNKEKVDRVSGQYTIMPLRFEGGINIVRMDSCQSEDVACLNEHIDISIRHNEISKKLGMIEYRFLGDQESDGQRPDLFVVYEDGSFEPLSQLLAIDLNGLNYGFIHLKKP